MANILSEFSAQYLRCTVGDNFVYVHIDRSACSALYRVGNKVLVVIAVQSLVAGGNDGVYDILFNVSVLSVYFCGDFFY